MNPSARKSRVVRAGAALLLAAAVIAVQTRIDPLRPARDPDDMAYLPNERLLTHFTGGLSNVMADYIWVQCCTYVGRQVKSTWNFEWLRQMVETVVRLDPYFVPAYRYGAMFLATLKAEDEAALDLLHRGMIINPDAWELPYEAAMVHLLNRREEADSKYNAALYLKLAVETGKAPGYVADVASSLQGQYNLIGLERDMWEKVKDSDDPFLSGLARTKLEELGIRSNVEVLNDLIERYRVEHGSMPTRIEQLVEAGYIPAVSPDPRGGRYFLGPDGQALNETLLSNAAREQRGHIENAIRRYRETHGKNPASLDELVGPDMFAQAPAHPWPGRQWRYDPATGALEETAE